MRRSFKAFKFFHRPLSRICALPVDRNDWQRKRATSKQLWPGLIVQADARHRSFDVMGLLSQHNTRWAVSKYKENQILYAQGDRADSVFYIHTGKVKVAVVSERGKEAIVAIRGPDEFCGEGALTGKPLRLATVTTMSTCEIVRLEKQAVVRLLHDDPDFADYFLNHLLIRTGRVEADLVDQLFNSSEMRLARALLLLANYGNWNRYP